MGSLCCCLKEDTPERTTASAVPVAGTDVVTPGGVVGTPDVTNIGEKSNKLDDLLKKEDSKREEIAESVVGMQLNVKVKNPFPNISRKLATVPPAIVCSGCGYSIAYCNHIVTNPEIRVSVDDSRKCLVVLQSSSNALPVTHEPRPARKSKQIFKTFGGDIYGTLNAPPHSLLTTSTSSTVVPLKQNEVCPNCEIFLGIILSVVVNGMTKRYIHLGMRYVRFINPATEEPIYERTIIRCASCQIPLSYTDQVLCTKRRWAMGQHACYMNSLIYDNVSLSSPREERLAQGKFIMADISCVCGKVIGYKFCQDLSRNSRNVYQVGRFGLLSSLFVVDGLG